MIQELRKFLSQDIVFLIWSFLHVFSGLEGLIARESGEGNFWTAFNGLDGDRQNLHVTRMEIDYQDELGKLKTDWQDYFLTWMVIDRISFWSERWWTVIASILDGDWLD
jgi:hypothetical protein